MSQARADRHTRDGHWSGALVDEYLWASASREPAAAFLVDRKGQHSYRELSEKVGRLVNHLETNGIKRGDVVSWILPNWSEAFVVHFAIVSLGAVSNPIVPTLRRHEVAYILEASQSRSVFVPGIYRNFDWIELIGELKKDLDHLREVIVVGSTHAEATSFEDITGPGREFRHPRAARTADDPMLLLYTSGTTSRPKGAVHTHNTLDYENRAMTAFYGLSSSSAIFMASPLTHVTGLLYGIQLPVMLGSTVIYQDEFEAGEALELLERHKVEITVAATPFLRRLVDHPDSTKRDLRKLTFVCGGADVPPDLVGIAEQKLRCCATRAYGSTEYPTVTGGTRADSLEKRSYTDGRVMDAVEVRIVTDDGDDAAVGEVGEVCLKGPELFVGYLGQDAGSGFDESGWFASGDLGSVDSDGYLTIAGRRKDMIVRGGENISAKEVEELLYTFPGVDEVALVGIPDSEMGERGCAVVVSRSDPPPTLEQLTAHMRDLGIATYKLPEMLVLAEELPKTASGKVKKYELREQLTGMRPAGPVRANPRARTEMEP